MARNKGQKTERRFLKEIGGKRQPASGAIPGLPNDGIKGPYLLEIKSTERDSLGVKRKWLNDLDVNAISIGKMPAFIIVFNDGISTAYADEWVAIPRWQFEKLTKDWRLT